MTAAIGWVETTVLFFSACGPKFTSYRIHPSLQRRFPIDDILFQTRDICNSQTCQKLSRKIDGFGPPNFFEDIFPRLGPRGALVSVRNSLACVKFFRH